MATQAVHEQLKAKYLKRLYINGILLFFSLFSGILGFALLEGYSWLDAIYMTIITLSTVGYGEVEKLSEHGKLFASIFIVMNIGIFAYALSTIVSFIAGGEFISFFKDYKNLRKVNMLQNHVIVCGYGRNGLQVCVELEKAGQPFVVIESSEKVIQKLQEEQKLYIQGNATDEEILKQARIDTAKAIITTLPEDAENVFVVLTARYLRKDILIISRASRENSEAKLKRAGADNVIMPERIGGTQMASLVVKPDILEFIAHLSGQDNNIGLEEIDANLLPEELHHRSIKELNVRRQTGAHIIAIRTETGDYVINPDPETLIQKGKKLILLGTKEELKKARDLLLNNII
ncbi:MAG: potassium channel protein [Bacteroidia bacterium]|nr:potassium channel protein [Bacteroidia bacterium]MDW8348350.1 NAD-binding protein [Bacteroidia bacterium]